MEYIYILSAASRTEALEKRFNCLFFFLLSRLVLLFLRVVGLNIHQLRQ